MSKENSSVDMAQIQIGVTSKKIKSILLNRKISINSLAKKIGMAQPTLNRQLEGESPLTYKTLLKISFALELPLEYLIMAIECEDYTDTKVLLNSLSDDSVYIVMQITLLKLKTLISNKNLSIRALAKKIGMAQSTLNRQLEGESPLTYRTLIKISSELNIPLERLISINLSNIDTYQFLLDALKDITKI